MQKWIKIGKVDVPVIEENGEIYYPLTYICRKILKGNDRTLINNSNKDIYKKYIKKFDVDYRANLKLVNCITKEGLKEVLKNKNYGRLSVAKRNGLNILLRHLKMDTVSEKELFIDNLPIEEWQKYDKYIKDIVSEIIEKEQVKFQLCLRCDTYYPLHKKFFHWQPHFNRFEKNMF